MCNIVRKNGEIKLLSKNDLLEIFNYLNQRLKENQLQLEITVYDGSIMTMVYDDRPAAKDVDCVFNNVNMSLFKNIIDTVKFAFNLSDDWINEEIKEPLKYLIKEEKEIYKNYSNLKILKPKAELLLAMKVLAARAEPSKDFVDAFLLCKELDIKSKEDLMKIVLKYIPRGLIDERQITFIKYLGKDLGYDWQ